MIENTRYSYYFRPFELSTDYESTSELNPSIITVPNHYVQVDLNKHPNGLVVAKLSVRLQVGRSVTPDKLPNITTNDGTVYHFESNGDHSFTEIELSHEQINNLELSLGSDLVGSIVIDADPPPHGVAVRFLFEIGTPVLK